MPRKTRVRIRPSGRLFRVGGYPWVSTEEQARGGVSIQGQIDKIRMFCELHELDLVKIVPDAGWSAKSLDRPASRRSLTTSRPRTARRPGHHQTLPVDPVAQDWSVLIKRYFRDDAWSEVVLGQ